MDQMNADHERSVPRFWLLSKRCFDLVISAVMLVVISPVLVVAMAGIFLVTGESPIVAQQRVGYRGKAFPMFKLRTMRSTKELLLLKTNARESAHLRRDPRLHALGVILRRTSVDELPSLFNVVRGEMSLVGPRPMLPQYVPGDASTLKYLRVKPGITSLSQVRSIRKTLSPGEALALEHEYVDRWNPLWDLAILAQTIPLDLRTAVRTIWLILVVLAPWLFSDQAAKPPSTTIAFSQRYAGDSRPDSETRTAAATSRDAHRQRSEPAAAPANDRSSASGDHRAPPRARSLYWAAETAGIFALGIVGTEIVTRQAFVSGTLVSVLAVAASTLFLTGRLLRSA